MIDKKDKSLEHFESFVRETAVSFQYPPTPEFVPKVTVHQKSPRFNAFSPKFVWAIAALVLIFASLFFVPQVRAAVLRFFQAGAISIFEFESTIPTQEETVQKFTPFVSEFGETVALQDAQEMLRNPVYLPADLDAPDQFILDSIEMPTMIVSLWLDNDVPAYSLYQIEVENFATKGANVAEQTRVNSQDAFWIEGTHVIRLEDGRFQSWLFVEGSVLIWWQGELTFRLEGAATLSEAVAIAESLTEIPIQE